MNAILTIAWKDVREHLRWALLAGLGLTALMAYIFGSDVSAQQASMVVLGASYMMVVGFGFPAVGAALGFLTLIMETRGDRWAFLIHRPSSPATLFWGKFAGAAMLYAVATVPGSACVWLWLWRPGHLAMPFFWGMCLPTAALWMVGLCCVPLGMMTVMRGARWYGSRVFPLAFGVVPAFGVFFFWEFWQAALWVAFATVIAAVAARAAFIAGQEQARCGGVGRFFGTSAVLPGVGVVLVLMVSVISMIFSKPYEYEWKNLVVFQDGTPAMQIHTRAGPTVKNLDGSENPDFMELQYSWDKIQRRTAPSAAFWSSPDLMGGGRLTTLLGKTRYYMTARFFTPIHDYSGGNNLWYFRPDRMRIEGYSLVDRTLIATAGPDGVQGGDKAHGERFTGEFLNTGYSGNRDGATPLVFSSAVYSFHIPQRTISRPSYTAEADERISSAQPWQGGEVLDAKMANRSDVRPGLVVTTDRKIVILDANDHEIHRFAAPESLKRPRGSMTLYELRNPTRMEVHSTTRGSNETLVHAFDSATGKLSDPRTYVIPPQPSPPANPPMEFAGGFFAGPAVSAFFLVIAYIEHSVTGTNPWAGEGPNMTRMAIGVAVSALVGCVGCLLVARRARLRRGKSFRWATLGLIGGVAGLLLMLCVEELPALVKCGSCGKRRALERDACEHCGAAFAPPVKDGSEVFEPLTVTR